MFGKVSENKIAANLWIFKSNFAAFRVPKVTVSKGNLFPLHFFFFLNPSFSSCLAINVGGGRISFKLAVPTHCFEFLIMTAE